VGDVERAIRLLGSAQAARESLNAPIPPREQPRYDRYLLSAKTAFDAERFAAVWRAGRLLNLDYVVSEAGLTLSE
jgi:hypothetical protein